MRRGLLGLALAAGLAVSAPALANSIFDYGGGFAFSDASVMLGDRTIRVYVHKSRNTLLLQPAVKELGRDPSNWPDADWQAAAAAFVRPLGCVIPQTLPLARATWEATYLCPAGIDLPALVKRQGQAVKDGAPLRP